MCTFNDYEKKGGRQVSHTSSSFFRLASTALSTVGVLEVLDVHFTGKNFLDSDTTNTRAGALVVRRSILAIGEF